MLLQLSADFNFWKDVLTVVSNLVTVGIVIFFLKRKIEAMTAQITGLKGQIEAQQGILNTSKFFFELFDLSKLKEYAAITEEKAKMEARITHQAELDAYKEQEKAKSDTLEKALKDANDSSEQIQLMKKALDADKTQIESIFNNLNRVSASEEAARRELALVKQELTFTRSLMPNSSVGPAKQLEFSDWGLTYNPFHYVKPPAIPPLISSVINPKEVYELMITHPFPSIKYYDTIVLVRKALEYKYPQLVTDDIKPVLDQYITDMAVEVVGPNVWSSQIL